MFDLVEECKLEMSITEMRGIINRLPLSDSIACLDYLLRHVWDDHKNTSCYEGVQGQLG
jgi:hypothetical protein